MKQIKEKRKWMKIMTENNGKTMNAFTTYM